AAPPSVNPGPAIPRSMRSGSPSVSSSNSVTVWLTSGEPANHRLGPAGRASRFEPRPRRPAVQKFLLPRGGADREDRRVAEDCLQEDVPAAFELRDQERVGRPELRGALHARDKHGVDLSALSTLVIDDGVEAEEVDLPVRAPSERPGSLAERSIGGDRQSGDEGKRRVA